MRVGAKPRHDPRRSGADAPVAIMQIEYQLEPGLAPGEFLDVLTRAGLGERLRVQPVEKIRRMLANASVILTARSDGLLIGVTRALSDFTFATYLSDIAVDEAYQRHGIGRELMRRTHEAAGLQTALILLAAPKAQGFYPQIGMKKNDTCWVFPGRMG